LPESNRRSLKGWLLQLYPFLLAIVQVLHLAAANPGVVTLGDIGSALGGILLVLLLVYAAAALFVRGRWDDRFPPLATLMAVAWFYGYGKVANRVALFTGHAPHLVLILGGIVLTVVLVRWLLRRPARLDALAGFLGIMAGLLVGWMGIEFAIEQARAWRELRESALIRRLERPIAVRPDAGAPSHRPDIYLIVVDGYANGGVLRERYGFDNRVFEDSLRRLGFVIPPVVRSNYVHTLLSLPSLLNASHLLELRDDPGPESSDPTVPNYLVAHSRAVRFLAGRGYEYVFFPSHWWQATRHAPQADVEPEVWPEFRLLPEMTRTELRRTLARSSVLGQFKRDYTIDADYLERTFAGLARVPARERPTFTFAHLIDPHRPYLYDSECRPAPMPTKESRAEPREAYLNQIRCLNGSLLDLVAKLLRDSSEPPVILIQGDHGSNTLRYTEDPAAATNPTAARERLGAFGAYYLPRGGAQAFGDTVTVVNVLGNVLRYYLGADLPREPDDMYRSLERLPYALRQVTALGDSSGSASHGAAVHDPSPPPSPPAAKRR
jgi:hypothetical protein